MQTRLKVCGLKVGMFGKPIQEREKGRMARGWGIGSALELGTSRLSVNKHGRE